MKGKEIVVRDLENVINERLEELAGLKYNNTAYHGMYQFAISEVLRGLGIQEIRVLAWDIRTDCEESGLCLHRDIAHVNVDLKRDKRYKYGGGRGVINSIKVSFLSNIMDMTLDQARRYLFEEHRKECIERLQKAREEAQANLDNIIENLADLAVMEF